MNSHTLPYFRAIIKGSYSHDGKHVKVVGRTRCCVISHVLKPHYSTSGIAPLTFHLHSNTCNHNSLCDFVMSVLHFSYLRPTATAPAPRSQISVPTLAVQATQPSWHRRPIGILLHRHADSERYRYNSCVADRMELSKGTYAKAVSPYRTFG
jgi:hypothetical protein